MPGFTTPEEFFGLIDRVFDGVAIWVSDPWAISYANQAFRQLIGEPDGVQGATLTPDRDPAMLRAQIVSLLDRFRNQGVEASTERTFLGEGRDRKPIEVRLHRFKRDGQLVFGMVVRGSTDEPSAMCHLVESARLDPLTGLPDRDFLMKRLATLLAGERIADRQFAVIFLDLDNFKQVNDEFGHLIGDDVLREAARRIAGCLREGDHVVRYGGDEFVAIVEDAATTREVEPVISRIHLALASPIAIPKGEVLLTLSAGIALAWETGGSAEELLAAADRAMYAAKRTAV